MTELVTIKIAQDAQANLLAQRPQIAREQTQDNTPIQIAHAEVDPDVRRAPKSADVGGEANGGEGESAFRQRDSRAELTGPSRARIVLRDFDVGKTPAEVVGTRDVVLRFDSNADGRIDIIESQRSARARSDVGATSYRGLAAAAAAAVAAFAADAAAEQATVPTTRPAPQQTEAPQRFGTSEDGTPIEQKKFSTEQDATPTAEPAQKFFGKGAEVAVAAGGQFAAAADAQPQKYADRAPQTDRGTATEASSGERKYYDKVAEAETDANGGDSEQPPPEQKKYTNVPGYTLTPQPATPTAATTVQVTA